MAMNVRPVIVPRLLTRLMGFRTQYVDLPAVDLYLSAYQSNGAPAIFIVDPADGQRVCTVTTNIDTPPAPGRVFVKTWSENEGVYEALVAAHVLGPVTRTLSNGQALVYECPLLIKPEDADD